MIFHRFISAFLWLTAVCFNVSDAFANDPFSILFGDDTIYTSKTDDAGPDNLVVLRLKIRHHLISKDWAAYELASGICIPISALAEAIEIPLASKGDEMEIADFATFQTLTFDPSQEAGFVKTEKDWCGFKTALETFFPVTIDYRASNLELIIMPKISLPIDERLAREEIRQSLKKAKETSNVSYRNVENPYRAISFPTLDFQFDSNVSSLGNKALNSYISGAADILWMNAHFQTTSDLRQQFRGNRLRLFRDNAHAEELSILRARRFGVGDLSSFSQPMISRSQAGRGVIVSNQPLHRPELFDETIVRGRLPEGWEAELFDNDILVAFTTEADLNGEYVFENVPLRPGLNHLMVRLIGPYGEINERHITQYVGAEHCPEDQWRYSFGAVDPQYSFLGESLINTQNFGATNPANIPSAFLSLEHGLTKNLTLRGDLNISEMQSLVSTSIVSSVLGGYGVARFALDDQGHPAWQINYQKSLSDRTSFSTKVSNFGQLKSTVNGFEESRVKSQISTRLDTRIGMRGHVLPLQSTFNYIERINDVSEYNANLRVSGHFKGAKWSHSLRYSFLSQPDARVRNIQGELLGSYTLSGMRLRSSANYSWVNGFTLNNITLSARKRLDKASQIQASVLYDMQSKVAAFEGSFSKSFKHLSLQTRAKFEQNNAWTLGVGLSFSLFHDENNKTFRLAKPGLSRSGVIAPRIFDDINNNGVFDESDTLLKGAQFIVENSLRSEESNEAGMNVIADLSPAKTINAEIKLSSIEDPFLRPLEVGRSFELRSGQVLSYDVPLTASGEIEGLMKVQNNGLDIPVAGIKLDAVDESGQVVGTTQTEYDGYFYIQDIPAKTLTLQISNKDLTSISGSFEPLTVALSREKPSKFGLLLTVIRESTSP